MSNLDVKPKLSRTTETEQAQSESAILRRVSSSRKIVTIEQAPGITYTLRREVWHGSTMIKIPLKIPESRSRSGLFVKKI